MYSISDVVSEIKDKPTRQRLQVLPYVIKFEEPNNESIRIGRSQYIVSILG